jgi:hypothetical protein
MLAGYWKLNPYSVLVYVFDVGAGAGGVVGLAGAAGAQAISASANRIARDMQVTKILNFDIALFCLPFIQCD